MTVARSMNAQFWATLGFPLQIVALRAHGAGPVRVLPIASKVELAQAFGQAEALNAKGWNIYYEVNVASQADKRSKAGDITALRAIVGDIDAKDGRTIDECREVVAGLPLPPSFVLFTGGGLQVVYLLQGRPAATPENIASHQAVGRALALLAEGDSVFDLPRIMRLPGFINHPTPQKAALGRQAANVMVEAASGQTHTLEELTGHFAPQPIAAPPLLSDALVGGITSGSTWFDRLSPQDKNACLADMLRVPAVLKLADTSDGDPSPNWRTIVASCARSGAPDAYALARNWAESSSRFEPSDFDSRWASYVK